MSTREQDAILRFARQITRDALWFAYALYLVGLFLGFQMGRAWE